jgi:hypothetical protein
MVIEYQVFIVHIFCARSITAQEDAGRAEVMDMITFEAIIAAMKVEPDARAARGPETAADHFAVFGASQPQQGVAFVPHFPVVLYAFVVVGPSVAVAFDKVEPFE